MYVLGFKMLNEYLRALFIYLDAVFQFVYAPNLF